MVWRCLSVVVLSTLPAASASAQGLPHNIPNFCANATIASVIRTGTLLIAGQTFTVTQHAAGDPPTITTQPQSQTIASAQTAALSVVATGTAPLSYQCYVGTSGSTSNPITEATASSYTTPMLTSTTSYWVRVANAFGSANSNTAIVGVPFTDDPLIIGSSVIRAVHVMELRTRIDALRGRFGLGGFAWSQALTTGPTPIRAQEGHR